MIDQRLDHPDLDGSVHPATTKDECDLRWSLTDQRHALLLTTSSTMMAD